MDEDATDAVGITDYELVALIDMDVTPEGRRALQAIGIDELLDDPTAVRAGYASLIVRGLASVDDEGIEADDVGAAVGELMATADDILRLDIVHDGDQVGRSVFFDASEGCFLLESDDFGVHTAQPLELTVDLTELIHDIIASVADGDGPGGPFDVTITRFPVQHEQRSAQLHVASVDDWRLVGSTVVGASRADVWRDALAQLGRSDADIASGARRAH